MHDIRLALGLIGFLSVGTFLGLRRLLGGVPPRTLDAMAVALVLLMAAYVKYVWGQLWIVNWIPLPSVIVLSNWFPLLLAALAAVVWLRMGGEATVAADESEDEHDELDEAAEPDTTEITETETHFGDDRALTIRRSLMVGIIVCCAIYSVMYFIPASPPVCGDEWVKPIPPLRWPVCKQTTDVTCSAASSATVLRTLGIMATEQEMAELCLTRRGTTWLGLYHGLSTKLLWTNYRTEFFQAEIADLPALAEKHPLLLCCLLDSSTAEQVPEYVTFGGWHPGTAHSVVYFGRVPAGHIIGDPSRGYELWSDQDLEILWTRQGLQIKDRPKRDGQSG